jgi:hypothetical protein
MRIKEAAAAAGLSLDARIAQIDQMTLEELAALSSGMATEVVTGKVTPREARTIDHAVGKRLKAIEEVLRRA